MKELTDNEIIKALECCSTEHCKKRDCPLFDYSRNTNDCIEHLSKKAIKLINRLQSQKEALIAGQETLQKALAEKDKEIEKLKAENEILQKNADEAFQEGLNENRGLFVKEVIQKIQQIICDNTYPGADSSGKAVMIWKARTGYDAIKDAILKMVGKTE